METLTVQDVWDASEISKLEEIADMRAKKPKANKDNQLDSDIEEDDGIEVKNLTDKKTYMEINDDGSGSLRISLEIPPYDIELV